MLRSLFLLAAVLAISVTAAMTRPLQKPTLAIVSSPEIDCGDAPANITATNGGCIESTYVKWAESAGIRPIPMAWNAPWKEQKALLTKVNGVLFAGGGLDGHPAVLEEYFKLVVAVMETAVTRFSHQSPLVLWGTCQGFQVMAAAAGKNLSVVTNQNIKDLYPGMLPLEFAPAQPNSRILGDANVPSSLRTIMQTQGVTLNYHHDSVLPYWFTQPGVGSLFDVITVNRDPYGTEFVSTIEAKNGLPFFAVQWHPEWPMYDWNDDRFARNLSVVKTSEYMGQFLQSQLMLSPQQFPTPEEAEMHAMERHPFEYRPYGRGKYWIAAQWVSNTGSDSKSCLTTSIVLILVAIATGCLGFLLGKYTQGRVMKRSALGGESAAAKSASMKDGVPQSPSQSDPMVDDTGLYRDIQ